MLKHLKNVPFDIAGNKVIIKPALKKVNVCRNWALKQAEKLVSAFSKSSGSYIGVVVAIEWSDLCVKLGNDIVFSQTKEDLKDEFCGIASHLKLP